MALSNWAVASVNERGEPTDGTFISHAGVHVEVRKNWIDILDEVAWHDRGFFTSPIIARVMTGAIEYGDVKIKAVRGPQAGVYAIIFSVGKRHDQTRDVRAMIAIGCYGYDDAGNFVGVRPESIDFLRKWIASVDLEDEEFVFADEITSIPIDRMDARRKALEQP